MRISFLHTAQVHVDTFDAIFQTLAPTVTLQHHVAPELLAQARAEGLDVVRDETIGILTNLASADAVVCTCSTLGPLLDGMTGTHILRIDRPVMEYACAQGENILVAICLESTRNSTLALLSECAAKTNQDISTDVVLCDSAWPFFEAGEIDLFAAQITQTIQNHLMCNNSFDCIVLAQASMHVAEPFLQDLGIPVVSSPMMAAKRALEIAHNK